MANYVTLARPYAKAVFEHALANDKLKAWSQALQFWALAVSEARTIKFINNPATDPSQHIDLLMGLITEPPVAGKGFKSELPALTNLVTLLAHNKRLLILPALSQLFDELRAEQEKTLNVQVLSFLALDKEQEQDLVSRLKKRLKRDIALNVSIDTALLGGAIIQAGDLVIDGSVRGELNKLRANLVA